MNIISIIFVIFNLSYLYYCYVNNLINNAPDIAILFFICNLCLLFDVIMSVLEKIKYFKKEI